MKGLFRFDPRLARELQAQRKDIVSGLICSGIAAVLGTGVLIYLVQQVTRAIAQKDEHMLVFLSGFVVVVFSVKYWFTRGQTFLLSRAAATLTADLRVKLFDKLQKLPLSFFNDRRAGAIQSVLTNDVAVYQSAIGVVRDSIDGPIKLATGLVSIVVIQPWLSLLPIGPFVVIWFFIQANQKKMRRAQDDVQEDLSNLTAMMQESLQGTRIIKSFNAEQRMRERFGGLIQKSLASQIVAARRMASLRPTVELLGGVGIALVVLISAKLVAENLLRIDQLLAFIFALDVINQGLRNIGSLKQTLAQVESATERIYSEVLDIPEYLDKPGARELPTAKGKVEFRNVSFTYPDGTEALRKVSFTIKPGASLALVGPSGSGKSTIADLLLRFYDPTEGEILFDGVDVRELRTEWLRSQIGVVPQQTFLFAGPIAENIRLGKLDASDDEVYEAAKAAHADVFVSLMPNAYQTELGERGIRLSGGEMQRIAIARAVVRKPMILLLDEATSALDAHSEKAVQEALDAIMSERTTLMIAHRLTTAARADLILVLRKGEVLECGTHHELMAADGAYAGMTRAFSQGVLDSV